jgi:hypothetical protein
MLSKDELDGLSGSIGEEVEDQAEAAMTWPRRLQKPTKCAGALLNITDLFLATTVKAARPERNTYTLPVA